jgi:nicotinamidase-related amidase
MTIPTLLDPSNCTVVLIDFQPQMAFAVRSIDGQTLVSNVEGLAKSAKAFDIPTVITTVAEKSFSGPTFSQIRDVFPDKPIIERTTMNMWEDRNVIHAIEKIGRKKLVLAGLWTEVCIALPALDAMREGYEVYVVADACGGTSPTAHDLAMQRMQMSGAVPITWIQFLLEQQRDWARDETYDKTLAIVKEHGGIYGLGAQYAKAMLPNAHEGR